MTCIPDIVPPQKFGAKTRLEQCARTGSINKPVMLLWTMDSAQVTNVLGHVAIGVKIVDPRDLDPVTGHRCACTSHETSAFHSR